MNWQTLMAGLESWLWQSPYLDVPNYAWIGSGLSLAVLVLYLILIFTAPKEEAETARAAEQEPPAPEPVEPEPAPAEAAPLPETAAPEPGPVPVPAPPPVPAAPKPEPPKPEPPKPEPPKPEPPKPEPPKPEPPKPEPAKPVPEEVELTPPEGWIARLKKGLAKTQSKLREGLEQFFSGGKLDADRMEELEEVLITSDLGVQTSLKLLERLQKAIDQEGLKGDQLKDWLKADVRTVMAQAERPLTVPAGHEGPYVIMVTGVNGTGKTTTIGKLALRFRKEGKSVLLGAADTFRAAAIQQLEIWAQRADAPIIKHQEGADPSAVAFDTIKAAQARNTDVVIIDTAGRLHTKANLMEELKKVKRIVGRELPGAPHETLLVLDATTGQNAVSQAKTFNQAIEITGLVMTKLDGTAKGGIIVAISDEFKLPIRFIGVGEKISDLQPFRADEFVEALFS